VNERATNFSSIETQIVRTSGLANLIFPKTTGKLQSGAHPTSHFRTLLFEFGQFQPGVDLQFPPNFMHVKDFSPRLLGTRPA